MEELVNQQTNKNKTYSQTRIKIATELANTNIIIGIFIINHQSYIYAHETWIRRVQKLRDTGFKIHIIWINVVNTKQLQYTKNYDFTTTDLLTISQSSNSKQFTNQDRFLNFCRLYLHNITHINNNKDYYVIVLNSTQYLNIDKLIYESSFQYYHRYGEFLWHSSAIDYYFDKKFKTLNLLPSPHHCQYNGLSVDIDISNSDYITRYQDITSISELSLTSLTANFRVKNSMQGFIKNPNYWQNDWIIYCKKTNKVQFFDVQQLISAYVYDYVDQLELFHLHHYLNKYIWESEPMIYDTSDLHFYRLFLPTAFDIITIERHLYWECSAIFINKYNQTHTLYQGKLFTTDGLLLRLYSDSFQNTYRPILSGDYIIIGNLSNNAVSNNYYIYKFDSIKNAVTTEQNVTLKIGDEIILVNNEKTGYLKYKEDAYKFQYFSENNNGIFSEKGVWKINYVL